VGWCLQGAVHGGAAAVEQQGEEFGREGDSQVEHGGQDLVGEGELEWATTLGVTVRGQDMGKVVEPMRLS